MIIHDLSQQDFTKLDWGTETDSIIISDNGSIHNCIGCFKCWTKTPGVCVLKDGYNNMGELLSKCNELVIISECVYGSYSPFVRNVLDRCLSYMLPYFETRNKETHHKMRYANKIALSVHFYGEHGVSQREQKTAKSLVVANGINMGTSESNAFFYQSVQDIGRRSL